MARWQRSLSQCGLAGSGHGSTVIVSTDGDIARMRLGNTTPARMVVVGIVDEVPSSAEADA